MRRITLLTLCCMTVLSSSAQLSGDGYYRIKNTETGRYISIVNNKVDNTNKSALKNGNNGTVFALKTVKSFSQVVSDPGTVIYIKKSGSGSSEYTIIGQGMNTYKLTGGLSLNIYKRSSDNFYYIYGSQSGFTLYLKDNGDKSDDDAEIEVAGNREKGYVKWQIVPIDKTDNYFGITPEYSAGSHHYTTLFTGFPYQVGNGTKAYYVKRYMVGGSSEYMAELTEITSGKVPAETAVVIECSSTNPADNVLTPLPDSESPAALKDNLLNGVYFSYVMMSVHGGELTNNLALQLKNVENYDPTTQRILGVSDGKISLVKATDLNYLPANKAYLNVPSSASASIAIVDSETYTAGIQNITEDTPIPCKGIFTLTGVRMATDNIESLPDGIYIVNGKKMIKR